MAVVWGVTVVVLLMTFPIVMRGRKIEVGMFSFLAALLFASVALRNAQPGSPPVGSFSVIAVWVYRPAAR